LRTNDLPPRGVVHAVTGFGPCTGAVLVASAGINKIAFTGGVPTARGILDSAAANITPSLMELCVAASRLFVHDAIHAAYLERFARAWGGCGSATRATMRRTLGRSSREPISSA
jgi:acyl-CoA reductase-like NAD-dependent aldehyde dehydrogenase